MTEEQKTKVVRLEQLSYFHELSFEETQSYVEAKVVTATSEEIASLFAED